MPRILPAIRGFIQKGMESQYDGDYVSNNGMLILNDYSDAENMEHHRNRKDTPILRPNIRFPENREPASRAPDDGMDTGCDIPDDEPYPLSEQAYEPEGRDPATIDRSVTPEKVSDVRTRNYLNRKSPGSFMEDFFKIAENNMRTKPIYSDCWLIGKRTELEKVTEYDTPSGKVLIGVAPDGEMEYNLIPNEYMHPDSLNAIIGNTIDSVREKFRKEGGRLDRSSVTSMARGILMDSSDTIEAVYGSDTCNLEAAIGEICDIVYRYTVGLGVFDILLADSKLEDIYIDAPCDKNRIHVTMNGIAGVNSHIRCRTNLIVDRKEVMNLINVLKRESGLPFCESNPILETDMSMHDARATVVGYPMSPNGDAVAIRKHSSRPWTLTRLIANGTMDAKTAGLLSFLVDNRVTFLVCGARGAGKSSLLSALLFEFPLSQRILTIEDTIELPGEMMRRMGYKVQSMLIDDRMSGSDLSKADEALRVSLRMGESAIILGEVRGEEAKTLYQSMRTGRAGSSIMGTIHGDSAQTVYERVVHDMNISPEAFMATEVLITLGTVRDRRTGNQIRKMNEVVATGSVPGDFIDITQNEKLFSSPMMRRVLSTSQLSRSEAIKEMRARGMIRAYLADVGNKYGEEYFDPEWIALSNDVISKNRAGTADDMLRIFRDRFRSMTGVGE